MGGFLFSLPIPISLLFGVVGAIAGTLTIALVLKNRQLPKLDVFGLLVSSAALLMLLLIPIILNSPSKQLDFTRHGYHSTPELYSFLVVSLMLVFQIGWGVARVFKASGLDRAAAIFWFGMMNVLSVVLAFVLGGWLGAMWAT